MNDIERVIHAIKIRILEGNLELENMAISALEHQLTNGWIPVSERLPEEDGYYLVSYKGGSVHIDFFWNGDRDTERKNTWENKYCYEILAWRKLPEPYKEVSE